MAIEGTGIKSPSKESSKKATAFLGGFQKKADEKFIKTYERKQEGGIPNSDFETDRYNKLKKKYGDQFSSDASTRFGNQFSPSVKVASADLGSLNIGDSFTKQVESNLADSSTGEAQPLSTPGSDEFNQEVKQFEKKVRKDTNMIDRFGTDELRRLTEEGQKRLEDSYKIYRDYNYERNPLKYQQGVDFSKKEEKKGFGERISNLAGSIFNTFTGTQQAAASQIPGGMPSVNQFSPSGDTSFSSFRMAGQVEQPKQSDTPFAEGGRGFNLPSNYAATEQAAFEKANKFVTSKENPSGGAVDTSFSSYVRGAKPGQERGNTGLAEARKIAERNPNVSINEKTGRAEATNDTGRAKAQAMAVNRKIQGKSISQTKADNKAAMRKSAAERQAAFKKTGKSTVGARRAAAKARVKAAAKKRHSAFKKRRAARRRSRRSRRGRR